MFQKNSLNKKTYYKLAAGFAISESCKSNSTLYVITHIKVFAWIESHQLRSQSFRTYVAN